MPLCQCKHNFLHCQSTSRADKSQVGRPPSGPCSISVGSAGAPMSCVRPHRDKSQAKDFTSKAGSSRISHPGRTSASAQSGSDISSPYFGLGGLSRRRYFPRATRQGSAVALAPSEPMHERSNQMPQIWGCLPEAPGFAKACRNGAINQAFVVKARARHLSFCAIKQAWVD